MLTTAFLVSAPWPWYFPAIAMYAPCMWSSVIWSATSSPSASLILSSANLAASLNFKYPSRNAASITRDRTGSSFCSCSAVMFMRVFLLKISPKSPKAAFRSSAAFWRSDFALAFSAFQKLLRNSPNASPVCAPENNSFPSGDSTRKRPLASFTTGLSFFSPLKMAPEASTV